MTREWEQTDRVTAPKFGERGGAHNYCNSIRLTKHSTLNEPLRKYYTYLNANYITQLSAGHDLPRLSLDQKVDYHVQRGPSLDRTRVTQIQSTSSPLLFEININIILSPPLIQLVA
jgi:hypothetical protein